MKKTSKEPAAVGGSGEDPVTSGLISSIRDRPTSSARPGRTNMLSVGAGRSDNRWHSAAAPLHQGPYYRLRRSHAESWRPIGCPKRRRSARMQRAGVFGTHDGRKCGALNSNAGTEIGRRSPRHVLQDAGESPRVGLDVHGSRPDAAVPRDLRDRLQVDPARPGA
jgi:hypothetical protein